jgi:hypothetical protein
VLHERRRPADEGVLCEEIVVPRCRLSGLGNPGLTLLCNRSCLDAIYCVPESEEMYPYSAPSLILVLADPFPQVLCGFEAQRVRRPPAGGPTL